MTHNAAVAWMTNIKALPLLLQYLLRLPRCQHVNAPATQQVFTSDMITSWSMA